MSAAVLALATDSLRVATMTCAVAASDSENCRAHAQHEAYNTSVPASIICPACETLHKLSCQLGND